MYSFLSFQVVLLSFIFAVDNNRYFIIFVFHNRLDLLNSHKIEVQGDDDYIDTNTNTNVDHFGVLYSSKTKTSD